MVKCVSVLGSTGSVGRQTLDIVRHLNIKVVALTAGTGVERLAQQCREFRPKLAVMATEEAAMELYRRVGDPSLEIAWGEEGLIRAATAEAECVVTAVVGMLGLKPTLAAIRAGKRIGLANKETLVCAGELVMAEAKKYGAEIVPVDSEHSAIFQCLVGCGDMREVKRLVLTCSGGPFFGMQRQQLMHATKEDALKHPNWKMGPKITVDCATLMNKGLEIIEAMRLYDMTSEQVDVVIHRQSIIHSLVEFTDGAMIAQMGVPDMRIPIQFAFTYPQRTACVAEPLDLIKCGPLTFCQPDVENFPCLTLARECAKAGGTSCTVMNCANEEAVGLFLAGKIGVYDIYDLVSRTVDTVPFIGEPDLAQILEAGEIARRIVKNS